MKYEFCGKEYNLCFTKEKYSNNGTLAVQSFTEDGEPWAVVTVNLPESKSLPKDVAFVDTNNTFDLINVMENAGLVEPTDFIGFSGFCMYPAYKFKTECFKEANKNGK